MKDIIDDEVVLEAIKALKELKQEDDWAEHHSEQKAKPTLTKVIYNEPTTVIEWSDGISTYYKEDGEFNPEKGFEYCVLKKMIGEKGFEAWRESCERLKKKVHLPSN